MVVRVVGCSVLESSDGVGEVIVPSEMWTCLPSDVAPVIVKLWFPREYDACPSVGW